MVLVHALRDGGELTYVDELVGSGARVVVVSPERPAGLPADWTFVEAPMVTEEVLASAVPDVAERRAFVSGSPLMVDAVTGALGRLGAVSVHTDRFNGY